MSLFYTGVRLLIKSYFFLLYGHKTYGLHHIPQGAGLIAANHASYFDPPLLAASFPSHIHFLARSSLFKKRFFGYAIRHLNAHPLTQAYGDVQAFKITLKLLKKGYQVAIFPEGERTSTGQLQALKEGVSKLAIKADVPIIPVYIAGSGAVWPRSKKYPLCYGKTACVIGSPLYSTALKAHKKQAQQELTLALKQKLEALKFWYEGGAQGMPP